MFAKVRLICKKCNCAMEFTTQYQFTSPAICQNCGQALEDKDQALISKAMSALQNLPSETETDSGAIYSDKGFRIALTVTATYLEPFEYDEEE